MSEDIKKDELEEKCCTDDSCGCNDKQGKEGCCDDHTDEGCGCGHDHDHDHEHGQHDMITLTMDDNEEVDCAVLGIFDVEDKEYIALLPNDSEDVFIYIYNETDDGEVSLENIESQDDFDKISAVFMEIIENEEDETEDEA